METLKKGGSLFKVDVRHSSDVFIVNFEQTAHIVLVFPFSTLNMIMTAWNISENVRVLKLNKEIKHSFENWCILIFYVLYSILLVFYLFS